eukprot:2673434-Rhodomonas_salina.1
MLARRCKTCASQHREGTGFQTSLSASSARATHSASAEETWSTTGGGKHHISLTTPLFTSETLTIILRGQAGERGRGRSVCRPCAPRAVLLVGVLGIQRLSLPGAMRALLSLV